MQKDGSDITLLSSPWFSKKTRRWNLAKLVPSSALQRNYWILICLHSLLITIHLILVAVIFAPPEGHLEHRFSVPVGRKANVLQVGIVVISQLFNVTVLASMLFLIQQLALRRVFHERQTLTSIHDSQSAWGGLGSAFMTLYVQRKRAASVLSLLCVATYLLGMSVLHITTPSLFSLATFNNTFPGYVQVTPGRPYISSPSPYLDFDGMTYVLSMLDLLANTNTTIGLHENIIFDAVGEARDYATQNIRPISSEVEVNATAFHVTCGLLPQARQNGTANTTLWNIITPLDDPSSRFDPAPIRTLTRYGIRFLPYQQDNTNTIGSQTALLYASVNITDNQGKNGTMLQLNPLIPGVSQNYRGLVSAEYLPDFQPVITACSLNLTNFTVKVDPTSRNITTASLHPRVVQTTWQDWQAPPVNSDPLIASWGSIFNTHVLTSIPANMCTRPQDFVGENNDCQTFDYLTTTEKYLNDRLGIRPISPSQASQVANGASVISLKDLEMRLEEMTAAVYWSAAHTPIPLPFMSDATYKPFPTYIDVRVSNANAQLNLNLIPVIIGLFVSVILLLMAIIVAREPGQNTLTTELNMVGILQFMWLLGMGSEAQTRIAEVENPTVDNLREAAMFEVRLDNLTRRGQQIEEYDL